MNPSNKDSTTKSNKPAGKSPVASYTRKKLVKAKAKTVATAEKTVETGSSNDAGGQGKTSAGDDIDVADGSQDDTISPSQKKSASNAALSEGTVAADILAAEVGAKTKEAVAKEVEYQEKTFKLINQYRTNQELEHLPLKTL
ncbi:unnamed protein product [Ambrosiozyma monospora]|uniref:Unnamed protein product n=1 Tax=Ambrosiozyma monospora TaxID=43982 RepID=A0ACB5T1Y1_AMBMO|nr:unnamed protein product [Ambrosiozyma monospora]